MIPIERTVNHRDRLLRTNHPSRRCPPPDRRNFHVELSSHNDLCRAFLAEPRPGGSLEELRPFLNVDDYAGRIRGYLVATLRPDVPCPVLVVKGDQGAGKSTACRAISRLIDPRTSALRGAPHNVRDLVAAARNSWLVCFDNLSHLPEELAIRLPISDRRRFRWTRVIQRS